MLNIKLDFNVQDIVSLSIKVNNLLLSYYNSEFKISHKSDDSPVTDADHSASELIIEQLHKITPGISVVSEENDLDENLAIIKEKSIVQQQIEKLKQYRKCLIHECVTGKRKIIND